MTKKSNEIQSHLSPIQKYQPFGEQVDFFAAMKAVSMGKQVTKLEWGDSEIFFGSRTERNILIYLLI